MDVHSPQDSGRDALGLLREAAAGLAALHTRFAHRHGLHPTDVRALAWLLDARGAGTPVTAGLLGSRLGLNSAGTTALVDRLERAGHVRRVPDPHDRRRVLIALERRAVTLARAVHAPLLDRSAELLKEYDERQLDAVREFLSTVLEAARAECADPGPGTVPVPRPRRGRATRPLPRRSPGR
ncbi:MarR family winged helix-turn-helix transcriptional regulator [Streptomyces sp. JNUCC 64]